MARSVECFSVGDGDDDFEDLPSASLSQTFFSVQRHRPGKQKKVQVMKRSAGFSAVLRPSPASLLQHSGDEESTPVGSVRGLLEPPNGLRKRLCKPVDRHLENSKMKINDGCKREGCIGTISFETPTRGAGMATGNKCISSFFEKSKDLQHDLEKDVRNTQKSETIGSTCDHDDNCKGEIFEEYFAAFKRPTQSSTTMQPRVSAALDALHSAASKGQILHIEKIPARPAAYTNQEFKLQKKLMKALQARGVKRFYTHQAAALRRVFNGSNIIATTPTASGKSMTYIIPVLNSLIKDSNLRALFIFPFKALARDQLKILSGLVAEVKKGSDCFG